MGEEPFVHPYLLLVFLGEMVHNVWEVRGRNLAARIFAKGTVTKLKDITKDLLARWRADYDSDASAHVLG